VIGQLPGDWWLFVIFGIGAGVVSGALGVGSGVVIIPVLALLCGFEQKSAQGTALAVMVPMAFVGAIRYWRNPQVELHGLIILLLVLGAVVGALAGTELAARLPGDLLRKVFAVFLVIVAVRMFTISPRRGHSPSTVHQPPTPGTMSLGGSSGSAAQR
jgi:uncharacterized membrane protein YfcA